MRKAIIKSGDKKLISAICEIVLNSLQGNFNINKSEFDKLSKYKKILRKLIQKSNLKD